jgi:hypothetical protein
MIRVWWMTYVMTSGHAECPNEVKPASPIPIEQAGDGHREDITNNGQNDKIPTMLPLHERIILQIGYIRWSWPEVGIKYNPPDVGP